MIEAPVGLPALLYVVSSFHPHDSPLTQFWRHLAETSEMETRPTGRSIISLPTVDTLSNLGNSDVVLTVHSLKQEPQTLVFLWLVIDLSHVGGGGSYSWHRPFFLLFYLIYFSVWLFSYDSFLIYCICPSGRCREALHGDVMRGEWGC